MLHALDELGLVDNTMLVLTTDHGLPFPGAKATLTDRGLGVLLIVRGPGGFLGGHVTDALVSQVDLYPTLCELAARHCPTAWPAARSCRWPAGRSARSATSSSPS